MKTRFTVELNIKDLSPVYSNDIDDDSVIEKDTLERIMHSVFEDTMEDIEETIKYKFEEMLSDSDANVTGNETLEDYGDIQISIERDE